MVEIEETIKDPRYFTSIQFSENYKLQHKEISIKVPRWMKLELKEYNFESLDIKKSTQYLSAEDADLITYTANNLPAMNREENSPGPSYLYPHILVMCKSAKPAGQQFTYFNTLADQYAWYHQLTTHNQQDSVAVAAKAHELTQTLATDLEKIKAIFYWMQSNIRYIAFEDGMAGFKPEKADEVIRKKYGDCKGMANLTKTMLKSLGYDARLCWLGTNHLAYNYETPCLAVDNHMICGLNFQGKMWYLDATETYLGLNEYAERIQGRQVLVENGDKYLLATIPATQSSQNYDYKQAKLKVSGTSLSGSINHLWKGEDKESVLNGLNSVKQEKAEDVLVKFVSDNNSNYQVTNLKLTNLTNYDKDLTATYDLEYKDAISSFDKALYINLDVKKEFGTAKIKAGRRHDYDFGYKANICTETELTLPDSYQVSHLPKPLHIINPNYEFHLQYTSVGGKLLYKKTMFLKNARLSKTGFAQWNKDIEQLAGSYNETVILKPTI
jgi:hypothetical protein